jgi:tRNA threonylcarbamoyladenosine biosynthesis protein TsaB
LNIDPTIAGGGILAIETSQPRGSVAWSAAPGATAVEEEFSIGLVHAREILPRIESLRARAGFSRGEIGAVAVSAGPGSFTGVRIGIAAAKALAWALGRPALAVSSLEVIARNCRSDGEVAVLLDARRGRAYGARFRRSGDALRRLSPDRSLPPEEFFRELPAETRLVGAGSRTLPGAAAFDRLPEACDTPRAAELGRVARERLDSIARGEAPAPVELEDVHRLVPFYLMRTGAEEARGLA